jgi:hypothetical protein
MASSIKILNKQPCQIEYINQLITLSAFPVCHLSNVIVFRLDPAGQQPEHGNDLKWYYGNYNNEDGDPLLDTTARNDASKASSSCVKTSGPSFVVMVAPVLYVLMLNF